MKRTITVLQDDIDNGCTLSSQNCAIALAAKRDLADLMLDSSYEVTVTQSRIGIYRTNCLHSFGGYRLTYEAVPPDEASAFVKRFDHELPVEPFKFEIELAGPFT